MTVFFYCSFDPLKLLQIDLDFFSIKKRKFKTCLKDSDFSINLPIICLDRIKKSKCFGKTSSLFESEYKILSLASSIGTILSLLKKIEA